MAKADDPITLGEILLTEFLEPLGITQCRLAQAINRASPGPDPRGRPWQAGLNHWASLFSVEIAFEEMNMVDRHDRAAE